MAKFDLSSEEQERLLAFLKTNHPVELVNGYLFFLQLRHGLDPVLFPRDQMIFQNAERAVEVLGCEEKIWKETKILVGTDTRSVNENTKKIYICPFTGKVFGDNTHPNPQDAIYDWVSRCPQNTERVNGLRVKRFFVSEDPEVIANYRKKSGSKKPLLKEVYSSLYSGKLFNTKEGAVTDFRKNYIKKYPLFDVPVQNRFQIEEGFLAFLKEHFTEEKITRFVESLSQLPNFSAYVSLWLDGE